jgi:hypothetical protein
VLTKVLGVDLQAVFMTMLALVGLYLVLTRSSALNALLKTTLKGTNESLIILQGRTGRGGLPKGY